MLILVLILGAALLFFLERKLYMNLWDRGLKMEVRFNEKSAFEGDTGTLLEVVENRNFLPLPFLHAKFEIGAGLTFENRENIATSDRNYKNDIFSILFYQRITRRLSFKCTKRGYYEVKSADLVSTDLFYSLHMVGQVEQNSAFYVYPRSVPVSDFDEPLLKMIGDVTSCQFLYPDPFEFRGIRDYTIADPMNTINWKASARTGSLMVNQYDSTTSKRIVILLNLQDETVVAHAPLHEEAIRIAGTLCARLLSEGLPVKLVCNGRDVESREPLREISAMGISGMDEIYRTLARIDLNLEKEPFTPLVKKEMEDPDFRNAGFIMLSSDQNKALQEAFSALSKEAVSLWITPLYKNMDFHVSPEGDGEVLRWEVKGYA